MTPEDFLLEMAEREECQSVMYKRMSIRMPIGLYNSRKANIYQIDSWMIPLAKVIKNKLEQNIVDIDALLKYMIENDKTNCALFAATTWFKP